MSGKNAPPPVLEFDRYVKHEKPVLERVVRHIHRAKMGELIDECQRPPGRFILPQNTALKLYGGCREAMATETLGELLHAAEFHERSSGQLNSGGKSPSSTAGKRLLHTLNGASRSRPRATTANARRTAASVPMPDEVIGGGASSSDDDARAQNGAAIRCIIEARRQHQRNNCGLTQSSRRHHDEARARNEAKRWETLAEREEFKRSYDNQDIKYKICFDKFDEDQSGTIDAAELKQAMRHMGLEVPQETVDSLLEQYDADNNGSLDLAEFKMLVLESFKSPDATSLVLTKSQLISKNKKVKKGGAVRKKREGSDWRTNMGNIVGHTEARQEWMRSLDQIAQDNIGLSSLVATHDQRPLPQMQRNASEEDYNHASASSTMSGSFDTGLVTLPSLLPGDIVYF